MLSRSTVRILASLEIPGFKWSEFSSSATKNYVSVRTLTPTGTSSTRAMSAAAAAAGSKLIDDLQSAKPFSSIPGPRGLPLIGNALSIPFNIKGGKQHLISMEYFAQYGPIYKETMFGTTIVHLSEVNAVEKLHRLDGKYPRRIHVLPWKEWRSENGHASGILITDGTDWKRMRTTLDKRMLRPKHVATYADNFNEVITDFVAHLRFLRDGKGGGKTVPNIDHELFHWSLETIGTVLYEVRLGGLSDNRQPRMTKFIKAVQDLFITTQSLFFLPAKLNRIFVRKPQRLHEESWDIVFNTTRLLIEEKLEKLKSEVASGKMEQEVGFLSFLLSTDMSLEEVFGNISELMLGAVDTTSNTFQWILYEVARRPDIQKQLHEEVTSVAPVGKLPTYDDIQEMPLLRAVVKEILRMYPVAGVSTRITNEDMVLCGYHVPVNTTVISSTFQLGRDPKLYPDPESFKPERWLRSKDSDHLHTFAWLPFGFGPRMCIGRRVAELEMHLLLARISQQFELKADPKPLLPKSAGLIVPERPVNVTFVDRRI